MELCKEIENVKNRKEQKLITSITKRLQSSNCLPHCAASLGYDIYVLISKFNLEEYEKIKFIDAFLAFLKKTHNENIIINQLNYALLLMNHPTKLEYEEIHKIFTLIDEIFSLKNLGLNWDPKSQRELDVALDIFFEKEPRRAKMVAKDRFEDWKREWWWYKNLI